MTELINQNPEVQQFSEIFANVEKVEKSCKAIIVSDDTSKEMALNILKNANDVVKAIDKKRTELVAPHLAKQRAINFAADLLSKGITEGIAIAKQRVLDYQKEQERLARIKAEEDAAKLRAEQARKETILAEINRMSDFLNDHVKTAKNMEELRNAHKELMASLKPKAFFAEYAAQAKIVIDLVPVVCKNREQEITTGEVTNTDMTALEIIKKTNEEVIVEAKVDTILTEVHGEKAIAGAGKGIRKTWKYRIKDKTAVPREFMSVDDAKIKGFMTANKEELSSQPVQGIEFYQDESVVLR